MKGIECVSKNRKYEAFVKIDGKRKLIGYWTTEAEAKLMRENYIKKHKLEAKDDNTKSINVRSKTILK